MDVSVSPAQAPSAPAATTGLVIEAGRAERHYWRDLWRYRELLGFLAWRDVKVRYKQAVLGVAWAFIQPALTTAIFVFVFRHLAKLPDGGVPYPLIVLSGVMAWQLFANALSGTSGSLVGNSSLISKVYFPRLLVPLSSLAVSLVDFSVVLAFFLGLSLWFGYWPSWHWLALPLFMAMALGAAFGLGLWFTALTVKYRDFRFLVPFLLQIGIFVSPVGYRADFFPQWRHLFALNPMTGIIDGFRWSLLGGQHALSPVALLVSLALIAITITGGLWFFRRTERKFADVI